MSNYATVDELKTAVIDRLKEMLSANTNYQIYLKLSEDAETAQAALDNLKSQRAEAYTSGNVDTVIELDNQITEKKAAIDLMTKRIAELNGRSILADAERIELGRMVNDGITQVRHDYMKGIADEIDHILDEMEAYDTILEGFAEINKSISQYQDYPEFRPTSPSYGELSRAKLKLDDVKYWILL